jgi:hypothetical protein
VDDRLEPSLPLLEVIEENEVVRMRLHHRIDTFNLSMVGKAPDQD